MFSAEKFDVSTLNWVKGEIDETLKQARFALEAYVENTDDLTQLQSCISHLHQVAGTLQMVELFGSARFASEVEQVAIALEKGEVGDRDHGYEVLMRAILQLPDYLESLLGGASDNPIALLPLLNELRQSRGEKPLAEAVFFNPDLSVMPQPAQQVARVDAKAAAHKLRPHYQAALLKFLQGADEAGQLKIISTVLEKLLSVVVMPRTRQWLWVAGGFTEGVREGGIELDNAHKQLLGKNDQLLKQMVESGEAGIKSEHMVVLVRTMLYQIARASSNGPLIRELREAFHLDSLVPASESGQALLGGFNAELKRTVSADILEELARVKETFDIYVRSDHSDVSSLTGIADSLGTMAETLVLLRQDILSDELREQSSVLHRIVRGEVIPHDGTLMGVAGTILSVESTLSDWGNASPVEKADDIAGQVSASEVGQLAETEHARVVRQVMKEARDGVIKVREAISQYLDHHDDKSGLAGVHAQLHEIVGGLSMLSYRRVAQVLRACDLFISRELVKGHTLPNPEKLDALADAIMSIEYYLEAFVQSRVHPASVLDVAERGVAELGYPVDNLPEQEISELHEASDAGYLEPVELSHPDVAVQMRAVPDTTAAVTLPVSTTYVNPEVDDEILEIFIEESQEEIAKIEGLLQKWSSNPEDDDALRDLRRCFHTLKGSGRLVGAATLGEFAWAFESMLNRVINGSVRPGPAMFDMLDQSCDALPQLVANFQYGTPLSSEVELLRQSAHEIVEPGGMQLNETPDTSVSQPAQAAVMAPEPPRIELDPVLLEIYEKETDGHLEQLQSFIDSYSSGTQRVNEPLIRALHTLTGSSRMAGVMPISDVSSLLEKYAKTIQVERIPIAEDGVELLADCIEYTRRVLAHLQDGENNPLPANNELVARAAALYETVMHAEERVAARPEAGLAAIPEEVVEPLAAPVELVLSDVGEPYENIELLPEPAAEVAGAFDLEKAFEILDAQAPSVTVEPILHHDTEQSEAARITSKPVTQPEEYDQDLQDIFLEEGSDILNASEETLQAWVKNPQDRTLAEMLQRYLHTLKGGARMAGVTAIGDLSHSLETTLEAVVEGRLSRSKRMMDLLQLAHDRLVVMLEQVRKHQPLSSGDDLIKEIYQLGREKTVEQEAAEVLTAPADTKTAEFTAPSVESQSGIDPLERLLLSGKDRIDQITDKAASWSRSPDEIELMQAIKSNAELLMQEAGAAVIVELTELAKAVTDLIRAIEDGHVPISEKVFTLLSASSERLALIFGQLVRRVALSNGLYLVANISELIKASIAERRIEAEALAEQTGEKVSAKELQREKTADTGAEEAGDNRRQGARVQHEMVRVRADLLDNMVNYAGEVSIYRSRVEQQLGSIRFNIDDLDQTVTRLRDQVRQFDIETEAQIDSRYREAEGQEYEEFDPLEFDRFTHMQQLSRSMMESLNDLQSIEEMMLNLSRESETLLLQQSRVNTELQETLMHTRMVPLVEHAPRLRRIVRQTCAELKKEANLSFKGADVEMDRNVVERILAPLEHMLRNSVAHGIETAEKRLTLNKAAEGSIVIAMSREGSEVVIRVSDDGGGINLDAVRRKAVEKGLMAPDTKLSDKEVMHFILEAGFSTAETLSQIAGRGVGMDVVASEIKQLGGILEIDSDPGKGTRFTIRLPLTLSVSRALLVYAGEDVYAIPLLSITGIERITKDELEQLLATENPQYRWVGQDYDLLHLSRALGVTTAAPVAEGEKISLLLAQSGENRVALAVDGLVGSREIVVKSLGPQLSTLQDISGATILADGHVALIIDLPALIRRGLARRGGVVVEAAPVVIESVPTVMVVDDSITVRKVTERLLKRHNMKCVTAKDGVDALAVLEDETPDVMLLDIEMPRMDGYELATHIRNSVRFKSLPIIMITSRTGEKHRQRAMEIGVNIYMGKPYTEGDLLGNIEQLLKQRRLQGRG